MKKYSWALALFPLFGVFGIGIQYRFGQIAIRGELESLGLSLDDDGDGESDDDDWIDFASLGVTWSF